MGRFAIGNKALGFSSGFAVKVGKDEPGPQRMRACSPGDAEETACGIATVIAKLHKMQDAIVLLSRHLKFGGRAGRCRVDDMKKLVQP